MAHAQDLLDDVVMERKAKGQTHSWPGVCMRDLMDAKELYLLDLEQAEEQREYQKAWESSLQAARDRVEARHNEESSDVPDGTRVSLQHHSPPVRARASVEAEIMVSLEGEAVIL